MSNFEHIFIGNKAKGRTSKRVLQENKAREIFQKINIFNPLISTRASAYQGIRNIFRKIRRALFSYNTRFAVCPFTSLPTCSPAQDMT